MATLGTRQKAAEDGLSIEHDCVQLYLAEGNAKPAIQSDTGNGDASLNTCSIRQNPEPVSPL